MKTMMKKLEALNKIKEYMKIVESNIMEVKKLVEFAHAETIDLKDGTLKNLIIPVKITDFSDHFPIFHFANRNIHHQPQSDNNFHMITEKNLLLF